MGFLDILNPFGGGGGGGSSFSSGGIGSGNDKSTETNTTSNTSYSDSRSVNDASGGGVVGSTVSNIDNGTTTFNWDGSEKTTWTWSSEDNSARTDNSQNSNSGNTTYNVTAGEAFTTVQSLGAAQIAGAVDIAGSALDLTGGVVNRAFNAIEVNNRGAFDFAGSSQAMSYASSASALGMVQSGFSKLAELSMDVVKAATSQTAQAAGQAKSAYQGAADTANGTRTLMVLGVAAAVLFGLYSWGRKA